MNNKNKNEKGGGWFTRIAGLVLCAAFAVGFGGIGLGALKSLTTMLHGAWTARSWQQVPAEVLDSGLSSKPDGDGGATYAVHARYRYEWAGRAYESTAVGLADKGSDNIDGWHHDWDARLRSAREGGTQVTAWVDPQHPERALLDPHLRWRKLLFMLPFAVLFPLVSLGAVAMAWVVATRAGRVDKPAEQHAPRHNALGLWFMTVFFSVLTMAGLGMASAPSTPVWVMLVMALFVVASLALLRATVRATQRAWTYRGTFASFQPAQPRAGATFQASWALPPRAAEQWPMHQAIRLRVAQYRIDDSGSGSIERLVQHLVQQVRPLPSPDGGLSLQARFELPADAPSHDSRRSGEKVAWRLEWLDAKDAVVLMVPIPVQATARVSDEAGDRFSPDTRSAQREIPAEPVSDAMPPLPEGVELSEQPDALVLAFALTRARWLGVIALVALAVAVTRSTVWLEAALLALGLHTLSRRWTLALRDDGLLMHRTSWLWQRCLSLPATSLPGLYQKWLYGHTDGNGMLGFHALWARGVDRGSDTRLTPGLQGTGAAQVAQMLRWARTQRAGRFSPGAQRTEPANTSRPAWGWALCGLWVAARLSMG